MEEAIKIYKTNEKIIIWMHRTGTTQSYIAEQIGITRQSFSQKMNDNIFTAFDIMTLKRLGCQL